MNRRITVRQGTVEHFLDVPDEKFEKYKQVIKKCIKGESNCLVIKAENGTEKFFPAELLRNSVIVFDPSEIELQMEGQKI